MKKYLIAIFAFFAINCVWAKPGDITNNLINNKLYVYFETHFKTVVDSNINETQELGRLFIKMVAGAKNEGTGKQAEYLAKLSTSKNFINRTVQGGRWDGYNGLQLCLLNQDFDTVKILLDAGCDPFYKHPRIGKSFSMMLQEKNQAMANIYRQMRQNAQEFMSDPNNTNNESANAIMNAALDVAQRFENSLRTNSQACDIAEKLYKFKPKNI